MSTYPILITGKNTIVLETFRYWLLSFYEHALEIETICIDSGALPMQSKARRYTLHIALMLDTSNASDGITEHLCFSCSCETVVAVVDSSRPGMQRCHGISVIQVSLARSMELVRELLARLHHIDSVQGASEPEEELRKDLTPREQEIIMQIAQGSSLKEISYALGISYHTVNAHKRNLFLKTGARTLRQLALYAIMHAHALSARSRPVLQPEERE